jgi:hypothetical protein
MNTDDVKERVRNLVFQRNTGHAWLQELVLDGFFDTPVSSKDVVIRIAEKFHKRWRTSKVQVYVKKFVGILHAIKPHGAQMNYWVLASVPRADALQFIGKSRRIVEVEETLFSNDLLKKLEKNFQQELNELHSVFGKYGNSTAFLLRKILEKLLIIVFRKVGKHDLIEDKKRPGGFIGLEAMIEFAMREKVNGASLLSGKTGNEVKGIKFLGDTAAHSALVNVDVEDILPQMPYLVTAYKELALHL